MGRKKGSSKYSPELVEALKMALGSGLTCTQAGEQFGLSYQAVRYATRVKNNERPIAGEMLARMQEERRNGATLLDIARRYHKSDADVCFALRGIPRGTPSADYKAPVQPLPISTGVSVTDNPPLEDGGDFIVRVYRGKEMATEVRLALYPNWRDMAEIFGSVGLYGADFQNVDSTRERIQRGYGYGQGGARIPFTIERLRDKPLCAADFVR